MDISQLTGHQGILIRFHEKTAQVFECVDPSAAGAVPAQQPGEIDLYVLKHSAFNANAAGVQNFFRLHTTTTAMLNSAVRRSEFRCHSDYFVVTLRFPSFNVKGNNFDIYSASLLIFQGRLLLVAPDGEVEFFAPPLREFLSGESYVWNEVTLPQLIHFLTDIVFRIYTDALENFSDVLKKLEFDIMDSGSREVFMMTTLVRKQNIFLQQTILPLKEMSFNMMHAEGAIIDQTMNNTLHTLSDQILRIVDSAGMLSEINSGLLDMYSNAQAARMNEIMRTLTVFSVLTLPVSVISSFYGMNFKYIPGLDWEYSLPVTLFSMTVLVLILVWICRRKHII